MAQKTNLKSVSHSQCDTDFSNDLQGNIYYKGIDTPANTGTAFQTTSFKLTEKGAKIKAYAQAHMIFGSPPPTPVRDFIFDRSFYTFLWKDGAKYPYLALWVDDTSILKKDL